MIHPTHSCIVMCMCVHASCVHACTGVYVCTHACVGVGLCMCVHACVCVCAHACLCCTTTCPLARIHTCMCLQLHLHFHNYRVVLIWSSLTNIYFQPCVSLACGLLQTKKNYWEHTQRHISLTGIQMSATG